MNADKTEVMQLEAAAPETGGSVLDGLLATHMRRTPKTDGRADVVNRFATLIGKLNGITESGIPLVDFADNPDKQPIPARHVCAVVLPDVGRDVVLAFENNDPRKPIIMGLLQSGETTASYEVEPAPVNAIVDGEQITLTGRNEIVLRCGKASITLTRAGKIIIRGAYVLTRSSGVNRIKGGSVQIN